MPEYVNNKIFHALLIEYRQNKSKKTYEEIGKCFLLISNNLLNKSNFINYTQDRKDEMVSDAVYLCVDMLIDTMLIDQTHLHILLLSQGTHFYKT